MSASIWKTEDGSWVGEFDHQRDLFALKVVRHKAANANWDDIAQAYLRDSAEKTRVAIAERASDTPWPTDRDHWPSLYVITVPGSVYCQANTERSLPLNWDRYTATEFTDCKMIAPATPPPVGTVVEYEGYVCRVRSGSLRPIDAPGHSGWWEDQVDWSRVTVVPVPEGWEPVATREEATVLITGRRACLARARGYDAWHDKTENGMDGDGSFTDYIWLRRKPAEQPFKPTDKQRAAMNTPTKTNGFMTTGALTVPSMDGIIEAARKLQQPAPVDVPVGSRWRDDHGHTFTADRVAGGWVNYSGTRAGSTRIEHFVANYTRLTDEPAAPAFVPRVAKREDIRPGAEVSRRLPRGTVVTVKVGEPAGNRRIYGTRIDTGDPWFFDSEEVDGGHWTLLRPAPEAQAFDPKDGWYRDEVGDILEVRGIWWSWVQLDGEPMEFNDGRESIDSLHRELPLTRIDAPVFKAKAPRFSAGDMVKVGDDPTPVRLVEVPTCAACSKPITGHTLELDEGDVKLCPGDACVNAYARGLRAKRYDPSEHVDACRSHQEGGGDSQTNDQAWAEELNWRHRDALHAAARDAHEANRYRREVGMCGPWVKGGR